MSLFVGITRIWLTLGKPFEHKLIDKSPRCVNDDVWICNTQSSSQCESGIMVGLCSLQGLMYYFDRGWTPPLWLSEREEVLQWRNSGRHSWREQVTCEWNSW